MRTHITPKKHTKNPPARAGLFNQNIVLSPPQPLSRAYSSMGIRSPRRDGHLAVGVQIVVGGGGRGDIFSHRNDTIAAAARNNFHFSPPCVGPYRHVSDSDISRAHFILAFATVVLIIIII